VPSSIPAPGSVPVLETERLRLRAHRPGDFADVIALWTDPAVTRFIGGRPSAPDEVWSRILRYAGLWSLLGFGYWAIEEKRTGRFAGELGFADFKRAIEPPLDGMPEFGWALASPLHGKGYGTEAARAALAWGDRHFGQARTVCIIHPDNIPSLRIAQKTGYRELKRTTYKGHPTIVFARPPAAEAT
jgi:RimJ/RimL family protein N-acetyltransferase